LVPTLAGSLTATDNLNLSATNKQADLFAQISPGIQVGGQTARLKGFLNYSLTASFYAQQRESSTFYNQLSAQGTVQAVENWLFVDASASISQQYISPFGSQSSDPSLNNPNRTEVSTVNLAPYVKGQIAGQVNYVGRAYYTYTDSGTSLASNSSSFGGLLSFDSTTRWSKLGWAVDLSYRGVAFQEGRDTHDQLNALSLNYAVTPDLRITLRGNAETSNLVSLQTETHYGLGGGMQWNPSPRTHLNLQYDSRAFGSSHAYSFDYRTPRTFWATSSTRARSTGQTNTRVGLPTPTFDLPFAWRKLLTSCARCTGSGTIDSSCANSKSKVVVGSPTRVLVCPVDSARVLLIAQKVRVVR
jgi:uncharacterized protein (PEP-CTERM system associated)